MRLTCHHEELPTTTPAPPERRAAAAAAAAAELSECRELLRYPSPLLRSPRMRQRYNQAITWAGLYYSIDKDETPWTWTNTTQCTPTTAETNTPATYKTPCPANTATPA